MVKNRQNQAIWSLGDEIFEILGGFCGLRNFDDFCIGEKSLENREFCGKLRFGARRAGGSAAEAVLEAQNLAELCVLFSTLSPANQGQRI